MIRDHKVAVRVAWSPPTTSEFPIVRYKVCRTSHCDDRYSPQNGSVMVESGMNNKNSRSSTGAEIARLVSRWTHDTVSEIIIVTEVQDSTFSIPHWPSSVEFGIIGYCNPSRLQHTGSQDTDLSCHMPISTLCCSM